ncbi:hypothetical protein DIPPA_07447 [Diplonema papillatum]|nr:hypothetical protein DIPPA_07447 [Diplonema papillatum]
MSGSRVSNTRVRIARVVLKLEPIDLAVAADGVPVVGRLTGNVFFSACNGHCLVLGLRHSAAAGDYIAGGDTSSGARTWPYQSFEAVYDRTAP